MRLFKTNQVYVYASCVYALNAIFLLCHSPKVSAPMHKTSPLFTVAPQMVGMALLAFLAFSYIRNTSSAIEKVVLLLTCILCVMFLAGSLSGFGFGWARIPSAHPIFVTISCAVALLATWRTLQIMTGSA
jgi:hypothetical protein